MLCQRIEVFFTRLRLAWRIACGRIRIERVERRPKKGFLLVEEKVIDRVPAGSTAVRDSDLAEYRRNARQLAMAISALSIAGKLKEFEEAIEKLGEGK